MEAKILRKWGLKAVDSKDSLPGSPVSQSSRDTRSGTPVDVRGLQAWLPPIPFFERQRLSDDVLRDLRYACAVVLKETTPADADIDQTDPLEEYRKAMVRAEQGDKQRAPKVEQTTHKPRKDSPRATGARQSSKQGHHAGNVALHGSSREVSSKDRLESTDSLPSGFPNPPKREPYRSASLIHHDSFRPPPHKAASSDYVVHESSRTSTTNPGSATTSSARDTAITSFSQSPLDTLRNSNHRSIGYPSNHSAGQDPTAMRPGSSSQQNATMTAWATGGRSQKEHEEAISAPVLRKAESRSSLRSQNGLRSRAESIRDGIKEYIRPGSSASRSSSRPGTSRSNNQQPTFSSAAAAPSRPESRGSRNSTPKENKRSWWKGGGLHRKGSFNSFRNSTGSNVGTEPGSPSAENGPDLDKSLPPMPSLDSYVEPPKEPKLHISQLMVPVAPTPPQNSLASPANLPSPSADLRSPMSFHTAQESPRTAHTPKLTTIPAARPSRSAHSPALTPGGSFPQPSRQMEHRPLEQRPKSSKSRSHASSKKPTDRNKPEPGYTAEQPVSRTFYSPAHQSASADLTQFSDAWREDLIQKEAERRLKRERERQLAKEQRKRAMEGPKGKGEKDKEKESVGIKNRLSRMFGSKSATRAQAAPATDTVTEALEPVEERGRGQGREVVAN